MTRATLIHIGMPKCASTWLQNQLFTPRNGYARRYGPLESNLAFISPRPFQWSLPQQLEKLKAAGDRVPTLSGETLAGNPLTGGADAEMILHRLQSALPDARVLVIIREQQRMLRSLYQLLVNWGSSHSIETMLSTALPGNAPAFDPDYLCYDNLVRAYQGAFGASRVMVLPYEELATNPGRFIEQINHFSGVDTEQYPTQVDAGKVVNPGRSLASLELKRWHNRYLARTVFDPRGVYQPGRIQANCNYSPWVPASISDWQERRFRRSTEAALGKYYVQSNRQTQALTGLDLSGLGYQTQE